MSLKSFLRSINKISPISTCQGACSLIIYGTNRGGEFVLRFAKDSRLACGATLLPDGNFRIWPKGVHSAQREGMSARCWKQINDLCYRTRPITVTPEEVAEYEYINVHNLCDHLS